jgi:hypothetical protein
VRRIRQYWPDTYGALVVHVKNEGLRTHGQARIDRASGLTKGAPDIVIPTCPPILIELKRRDHTKSSWQDGQLDYLMVAQKAGALVCVALGADAATEWIKRHVAR